VSEIDEGIVLRFENMMNLLLAGKKIYPVSGRNFVDKDNIQFKVVLRDGRVLYSEDNTKFPKLGMELYHDAKVTEVAVTAHGTGRCLPIQYVRANGQHNRLMAKLVGQEDEVPYTLDILDVYWTKWEEYKPTMRVGFKANIYDCSECGDKHIDMNVGIINGVAQTSCPVTNKLILLKE
jgi:hypothetical protein